MTTDQIVNPEQIMASLTGLKMVVSSGLPMEPSPSEEARRIVRHGFAAARAEKGWACYFPDSLGDVGQKPGEPVRALRAGDLLFVDRDLALQIDEEARRVAGLEAARRLWREHENRRWRAIEAGIMVVLNSALAPPHRFGPVTAVRSYKIDHQLDQTIVRAHFGGELETEGFALGVDDERIRRLLGMGDAELIRQIASDLLVGVRRALVEHKLADEEAGRGR